MLRLWQRRTHLLVIIASCCSLLACCMDRSPVGGFCPSQCAPRADGQGCECSLVAGGGGADAAASADADSGTCNAGSCTSTPDAGVCAPALIRQRLALIMVVDYSAAMSPYAGIMMAGMRDFLAEGASSGVAIGLQFFDEVCEAQHYAMPVVPIAELPGNASALQNTVPATALATTSKIPALTGALQSAINWATTHKTDRVAVLLVTDASPGACDAAGSTDYESEVTRIARAGHDSVPSVPTYVVGFGALPMIASIAVAGGTTPTVINILSPATEVRAGFERARDDARPCAFRWPDTVTLSASSQVVVNAARSSARRYDIQPSRSACDPDRPGFYIENMVADFPLIACPVTCAALTPDDEITLSDVQCSSP